MNEIDHDGYELKQPVELNDSLPEDRTYFYELAESSIEYQTREQNRKWVQKYFDGNGVNEVVASFILGVGQGSDSKNGNKKLIHGLKFVVNQGFFEDASVLLGENCVDLIPYVMEHEIFEAWLIAKNGYGQNLTKSERHLLATRREYLLAEKDSMGNKLYRFSLLAYPKDKEENLGGLEYAKKRLKKSAADQFTTLSRPSI